MTGDRARSKTRRGRVYSQLPGSTKLIGERTDAMSDRLQSALGNYLRPAQKEFQKAKEESSHTGHLRVLFSEEALLLRSVDRVEKSEESSELAEATALDHRQAGSAEFIPAELRGISLAWTRHKSRRLARAWRAKRGRGESALPACNPCQPRAEFLH